MSERYHCLFPWLLAVLLVLGFSSGVLQAANPQAAFVMEEGFLTVQLLEDDRPVKDAKIRLVDLAGQTITDGICDEKGQGTLGLGSGQTFLVGIQILGKKKEADLITLRRQGKEGITPTRVLLSFSKPCCRVTSAPTRPSAIVVEEEPATPRFRDDWRIWLGAGSSCLLAAGTLFLVLRRP